MSLFPKRRELLNAEEKNRIIEAVRSAEQRTSGEIRVFVENRCKYVDAIDEAAEIFFGLEMQKTELRNAVLIYVALKDRQVAIFGDEGIHKKVGNEYWRDKVKNMIGNFKHHDYAEGIRQCVLDVGEALHAHFPYERQIDKNELPDDIVFGK